MLCFSRRLVPLESDLLFRRTKGSELQLDQHAMPTEEDEARGLVNRCVRTYKMTGSSVECNEKIGTLQVETESTLSKATDLV